MASYEKITYLKDDTDPAIVNDDKTITGLETHTLICGEANSEYITFLVPRKFDGVDLADKQITIHYNNSRGRYDQTDPVNVETTTLDGNDYLKFGWLVPAGVCEAAGDSTFCIYFESDGYRLKTQDADLAVLSCKNELDSIPEPTDVGWYSTLKLEFEEIVEQSSQLTRDAADALAEVVVKLEVLDGMTEQFEEVQQTIDGLDERVTVLDEKMISMEDIQTAGEAQVAAIEEKGQEVLDSIPDDYETLTQKVEDIEGQLDNLDVETDKTLTIENKAADAKAVGDAIAVLRQALDNQASVVEITQSANGINVVYSDGTSEEIEVGGSGSGGLNFDTGYQDEDGYIHLTKDGEDIEGFDPFIVAGGGGGGGGGSKITFACYTPATMSVLESTGTAPIEFKFASIDTETKTETGSGTLSVSVNGTQRVNLNIPQGDHQTVDVFPYLTKGSNAVVLVMTDSYGTTATRKFTVTMESFSVAWDLDDTVKNTESNLSFYITPAGSGTKTIYTYVDGSLYDTDTVATSGRRITKTVSGLTHGAHKIEVYGEMTVSGVVMQSNHLTAMIAQVVAGNNTPVVAVGWPDSLTQYTTAAIPYMVVDPQNNPTDIQLLINGVSQGETSCDQSDHIWSYRPVISGSVTLGILCGTTLSEKLITVESIGSDVDEVTDGLAIKVDPSVMSDLASWSYGSYKFTLSDNFDLTNGGLQTDEDGIHCIRITAGDRLTLNYPMFSGDARRTGKSAKIIYRVADSSAKDAVAISCMSAGIGLHAKANNVYLSGDQTTITMSVCEDEKTELDINIQQDSEDKLMCLYESCSTFVINQYAANESFTQSEGITFGSDDADVYLYLFRGYSRDLTDEEIRTNYICDGADATSIKNRKDRNDIYDSTGNIDVEVAAAKNPNCHFLILNAPRMTVGKKDVVTATLSHIYVAGGSTHRFTAPIEMNIQGTSSVEHAETAGGNLTLKFTSGITLEDGTHKDGYAMNGEENSVPITVLNFKKNIASEDHIVNKMCAEWYNRYQPTVRQERIDDPRVRDCMESVMCAVFFHNTSSAAVQVGPDIVEPDETAFFGLGNLCTDKGAAEAYQYEPIVIEVKNNTEPQVRFKSDDLTGDNFSNNFEYRYLDTDLYTEAQAQAIFQSMMSFVVACDVTAATNTALPRVITIDGQAFSVDSEAYRRAKWIAEAPNYFDMPGLYWHHNDTLFHLLRDNRAKNMFWSYRPSTGTWSLKFNWDNDTGHCRNNEGYIDIEPGYLDFDTIGTADVFNGADNVIFTNLRECNFAELQAAYIDRESAGAWNIDTIYDYCMTNQEYICEALWLEDAQHNAIRTMQNLGTTAYLERATGRLRLHLKKSLTFQKVLVDSYYNSTAATSESASFRGYTPSSWAGVQPSGLLDITPYTDMYINILAGSIAYRERAYAGQAVTIDISSSLNDTEIYLRHAPWIMRLGSMAGMYLGQFEARKLTRVRTLLIGSDVAGYQNTNFTTGSFDNCAKLEEINLGGLVNAQKAFDFSPNIYLQKIYTKGSGVTGLTFAKNGRLKEAYLNAVASLYMSGLRLMETFDMENYASLTSVTVEDSPAVDSYALVSAALNLARVRLLEIDWSVPVAAYDTLMRMKGIHGIDDEGYDVAEGVVTGDVYFRSISRSKYDAIVAAMPKISFSYGELLEEVTVTFQNDDGTTLYVTKTEKGGSVTDPITAGYISTPTKASTVDKTYTYYKWDTSLDYIVEDTTITATYSEADRSYTVKFEDYDGTVLETYTVAAHGSASYSGEDLSRSGYIWAGWSAIADDVQEDMEIKATYIYPTMPSEVKDVTQYDFAYSDDPADSSAYNFGEFYSIIKTGRTATYLPIKSLVKMVISSDKITDSYIIFNLHSIGHYALADGSGMSSADFFMTHILIANRQMNGSSTNAGGWDQCALRTWLNKTLWPTLPAHWRQLMAQAITLASAGSQTSTITQSTDYLRLMSHAEVGSDTTSVPYKDEIDSNASEVTFSQYTNNTARVKKNYYGTGTAQNYWLRSADGGSASAFRVVANSGNTGTIAANYSNGVCFGFSA